MKGVCLKRQMGGKFSLQTNTINKLSPFIVKTNPISVIINYERSGTNAIVCPALSEELEQFRWETMDALCLNVLQEQ